MTTGRKAGIRILRTLCGSDDSFGGTWYWATKNIKYIRIASIGVCNP